jgi:hypothetical protein
MHLVNHNGLVYEFHIFFSWICIFLVATSFHYSSFWCSPNTIIGLMWVGLNMLYPIWIRHLIPRNQATHIPALLYVGPNVSSITHVIHGQDYRTWGHSFSCLGTCLWATWLQGGGMVCTIAQGLLTLLGPSQHKQEPHKSIPTRPGIR